MPWIVAAVVLVVALVVGAVVVLSGDDDAEAGEIFLEPAADVGEDPFATGLEGDAVEVTTTTAQATTTTAGDDGQAAQATPAVSGGRPGLYGGTRDAATCDPQQQADFLAANPAVASAFVAALNADPTLRWSGGTSVSTSEIGAYLAELTPVVLTADTRVTNHGYRNGRPTPRQAVLQAGTAVLVDAYGVPRVKCNCGNPLTEPAPVPVTPVYVGPKWPGFTPTTVVVITEVTVEIDVFILVDVVTGDTFTRPAGTTGADDGDDSTSTTDPPTTDPPATDPPATDPPATQPSIPTGGDQAAFCAGWQDALTRYADIDPSVPETIRVLEELTALAPPDIRPAMETILAAARDAAANGRDEIDVDLYPEADAAIFSIISYLETSCGISEY